MMFFFACFLDIQPKNMSFLDINVNEEPFKNVEYILLDPSCSGSGIVNRLDFSSFLVQMVTKLVLRTVSQS
jgi:16S rRNA C967 or C1407 C5-methylase (RsmB/RsmF family)